MSTKIPISDDSAPAEPSFPAGLPDVASLAQLANEFFRMLPTGEGRPGAGEVPGVPPAPDVSQISSVPPIDLPDHASRSQSSGASHFDRSSLEVPDAYAPALPRVESVPIPALNTPFNFPEGANPYLSQPKPPASAVDFDDRVTVQPYGLPGADQLNVVLSQIRSGYPHEASPATSADRDQQFYFLAPAATGTSGSPARTKNTEAPFDVYTIRRDFPALHQKVNGKPLIWLDSGATSQKPQAVIDAVSYFYEHDNSNVHRGAHALAARATDAYEGARQKIQHFLGAASSEEIVFVRGTTEGINLLAQTCGRLRIGPGDEIVVTTFEHHANIVPWQMLAKEKGATLKPIPISDQGEVLLNEYVKLLGPRTKIVALAHVSNTLGTVVPIELMTALAHQAGAAVVIDGAQSVPHFRVNVRAIDCDFFVFSGHKLFGPTGIGVLYGKKALLEQMPPWQGGGNMIDHVTFEHTTYNKVPYKFEAGTGDISGAVGLGAAIDYLNRIDFDAATRHEDGLVAYAAQGLSTIPGLRLMGTAPHKVGTTSFVLDGIRPEAVGKFLDREGIAVRAGHHCAQPTMQRFGVEGMVRPSFAIYNTYEEVDALVSAVWKAKKALSS